MAIPNSPRMSTRSGHTRKSVYKGWGNSIRANPSGYRSCPSLTGSDVATIFDRRSYVPPYLHHPPPLRASDLNSHREASTSPSCWFHGRNRMFLRRGTTFRLSIDETNVTSAITWSSKDSEQMFQKFQVPDHQHANRSMNDDG